MSKPSALSSPQFCLNKKDTVSYALSEIRFAAALLLYSDLGRALALVVKEYGSLGEHSIGTEFVSILYSLHFRKTPCYVHYYQIIVF